MFTCSKKYMENTIGNSNFSLSIKKIMDIIEKVMIYNHNTF